MNCRRFGPFLSVALGASLVSITPEMVAVLGLEGRLGEEIDVTLADGSRARGKRVTIPKLTVLGVSRDEVPAVVLPTMAVGVDGLLGLSFLKHFRLQTDDSAALEVWLGEERNGDRDQIAGI